MEAGPRIAGMTCALLALACMGPQGPQGPRGDPGDPGQQGPRGQDGTFTGTFNGPATFNGSITVDGTLQFQPDAGISGDVEVSGAIVRAGPSGRISVNGIYCGRSASPTTGNLQYNSAVGYQAAKGICEAACGNALAHLCSAEEIVRSLQVGSFTPYPPEDLWFSSAIRINAVNDCDGWQCGQPGFQPCSTELGSMLQRQDRLINTQTCNTAIRLACCL